MAAINIARVLKRFIENNLIAPSLRFNVWHVRNNKTIRLESDFVDIRYKNRNDFLRMRLFHEATSEVPYLKKYILSLIHLMIKILDYA